MRRLGLFKICAVAWLPATLLAQNVMREGGRWVQTVSGTAPPATRIRVNWQGPVRVDGRSANRITYTAKLSVEARNEQEARRILSQFAVRVSSAGDQVALVAPGGPIVANLTVKTPALAAVNISTLDGGVEAYGIDGQLEVTSGAGALKADQVKGPVSLTTAGGEIQVGEVGGALRCNTAGGQIAVKRVRGDAVLQTSGGYIDVGEAGGTVEADTAGGMIHVGNAAGSVVASTGGGSIRVDKAGGIVTARNFAGPVQVGAAAGVRCESGSGGVRISNISGPMRVSTSVGSIVASLLSGAGLADSFLTTGNGDITVLIPSNLKVTIRADAPRNIVSDFPDIAVVMRGPQVVAEGDVNGGGPVLRISGRGGTIFIKRQ
jgi:hypothetical protein